LPPAPDWDRQRYRAMKLMTRSAGSASRVDASAPHNLRPRPASERLTSPPTVGSNLRKRRSAQRWTAPYSHGGSQGHLLIGLVTRLVLSERDGVSRAGGGCEARLPGSPGRRPAGRPRWRRRLEVRGRAPGRSLEHQHGRQQDHQGHQRAGGEPARQVHGAAQLGYLLQQRPAVGVGQGHGTW
jgi:hypothetical protein